MSNSPLWNSRDFSQELDRIVDSFKQKLNLIGNLNQNNFTDYDNQESDSEFGICEDLPSDYSNSSDSDSDSCTEYYSETDTESKEIEPTRKLVPIKKYFKPKRSLDFYPPSTYIKQAQAHSFSNAGLSNTNDEFIRNYLKAPELNSENCHHIFKMLIQMEDSTVLTTYASLTQKDLVLSNTERSGEYWISIENTPKIDEVLTAFMDDVVIVPKASALSQVPPTGANAIDVLLPHEDEFSLDRQFRRHVAQVEQVSKDRVYFRFKPKENVHLSVANIKYDIIFRPGRLPIRYQHRALELLEQDAKMRSFLFPTVKPNKEMPDINLKLINLDIGSNPEQLQAVRHILQSRMVYAPYVIFGPPGTGKTTTVVESIIQLRLHQPGSRILVTAGSNSACDTIALRICKYFNSSPQIRPADMERAHMIRVFAKSVEHKGLHLLDKTLLEHSNCRSGKHYYPAVREIRKFDIIVATLSTVGKLVTGDLGANEYFTHIFIDEAGASTEPETLVGIMGIKSPHCSLILCGDHKQLGPVLRCERAAALGLEVSMMERLLRRSCYEIDANGNYNRSLQTRLCRNYRSHPAIVGLYNQLYYAGELVANAEYEATHLASNWHILPNARFPIIFQAVHGKSGKEEGSNSTYNQLEIQVLMWYLQRLLVDGIDGKSVQQSDIGIITPYKLQYRRIQTQLSQRSWDAVDVGSVETFQGREKPIILVSLVRSFSGLGFIKSPRRLNVLLSRAKSLLILLGNPLTLRRNHDFKYIIDECKKHQTFLRKKKMLPPWLSKGHKPSEVVTVKATATVEEPNGLIQKEEEASRKFVLPIKKSEHTSTPILNKSVISDDLNNNNEPAKLPIKNDIMSNVIEIQKEIKDLKLLITETFSENIEKTAIIEINDDALNSDLQIEIKEQTDIIEIKDEDDMRMIRITNIETTNVIEINDDELRTDLQSENIDITQIRIETIDNNNVIEINENDDDIIMIKKDQQIKNVKAIDVIEINDEAEDADITMTDLRINKERTEIIEIKDDDDEDARITDIIEIADDEDIEELLSSDDETECIITHKLEVTELPEASDDVSTSIEMTKLNSQIPHRIPLKLMRCVSPTYVNFNQSFDAIKHYTKTELMQYAEQINPKMHMLSTDDDNNNNNNECIINLNLEHNPINNENNKNHMNIKHNIDFNIYPQRQFVKRKLVTVADLKNCPRKDFISSINRDLNNSTKPIIAELQDPKQARILILRKIMRPCWKCPQNFLPGITTIVAEQPLRYSREDLLKFLPTSIIQQM